MEAELALEVAVSRIDNGAVHGARQPQPGRELRAHMGPEIHKRRDRKAVPIHGDGPMRLRQVIGSAEANEQWRRGVGGGGGLQFELL